MKTKKLIPAIEKEIELYNEDSFLDMLNEVYGEVNICGMIMDAGTVLKECDPIAFRCAMNDSQEYKTKYCCPICGEEHDDEDKANFCCQDRNIFECEICGETFESEEEAQECEDSHEEKEI